MYRRHSVWVDVFGIVALCALLLVPLGILATEMMGGGGRSGGGIVASGSGGAAASPRSGPAPWRSSRPAPPSAPWTAAHEGRSERSGSAVPFSKSWREQATPSLTGPSDRTRSGGHSFGRGSGSAASTGDSERSAFGTDGGGRQASFGQRSGRAGDGGTRNGGTRNGGAGWRRAADRLAGRARALSNQLGALQHESEDRGTARSERQPAGEPASAGAAATADDNPPLPPSVPIDDHLHWLLVAGILWGAWRIGRGG